MDWRESSRSRSRSRSHMDWRATSRSPPSDLTQDLGMPSGKGASDETDGSATVCRNCQTTHAPLWRGQSLCEGCSLSYVSFVQRSGSFVSVLVTDSLFTQKPVQPQPLDDLTARVIKRYGYFSTTEKVHPDPCQTGGAYEGR